MKNRIITALMLVALASCASQETPRDVETVSSDKIKTLFPPKVTNADEKGLSIRYAEVSMGFDATCNPFKSFSDKLNDCNELPENVKTLAVDHCDQFGKKAVFMGNKTTMLQMTLSKFTCQDKD
ncbi:MAG: hypothetical protein P8J42_04865 [Pseudomonadales bacterium]|nr:hypothetical protein [Pseudomonadales bacterium]MDG2035931.1 hypothetical protein [Pseudomonadales bacterium]